MIEISEQPMARWRRMLLELSSDAATIGAKYVEFTDKLQALQKELIAQGNRAAGKADRDLFPSKREKDAGSQTQHLSSATQAAIPVTVRRRHAQTNRATGPAPQLGRARTTATQKASHRSEQTNSIGCTGSASIGGLEAEN
jgi:hypothetical protein